MYLKLHPDETVHGRHENTDFSLTNRRGGLRITFADSANVVTLQIPANPSFVADSLRVSFKEASNDGSIRVSVNGAAILYHKLYLDPANARTDAEHLHVEIQEYYLAGGRTRNQREQDSFLNKIDDLLDNIEEQYSEQKETLNEIFECCEGDYLIDALKGVRQLTEEIRVAALHPEEPSTAL